MENQKLGRSGLAEPRASNLPRNQPSEATAWAMKEAPKMPRRRASGALSYGVRWMPTQKGACRIFPGSIAKGSSSKSGCQLHLPTSHANLSRVTSPANFSRQLVESYFTCQLLMPTCRELLHLPTSHVNLLRVTSPANFSCQLFGCYLILL